MSARYSIPRMWPVLYKYFEDQDHKATPEEVLSYFWDGKYFQGKAETFYEEVVRGLRDYLSHLWVPELNVGAAVEATMKGYNEYNVVHRTRRAMLRVIESALQSPGTYDEPGLDNAVVTAFFLEYNRILAGVRAVYRDMVATAQSWWIFFARRYILFVSAYSIIMTGVPLIFTLMSGWAQSLSEMVRYSSVGGAPGTAGTAVRILDWIAVGLSGMARVARFVRFAHLKLAAKVFPIRYEAGAGFYFGWARDLKELVGMVRQAVRVFMQGVAWVSNQFVSGEEIWDDVVRIYNSGKDLGIVNQNALSVATGVATALPYVGVAAVAAALGAGLALLLIKEIPGLDSAGWFRQPEPAPPLPDDVQGLVQGAVRSAAVRITPVIKEAKSLIDEAEQLITSAGEMQDETSWAELSGRLRDVKDRIISCRQRVANSAGVNAWEEDALKDSRDATYVALADVEERINGALSREKLGAAIGGGEFAISEEDMRPYIDPMELLGILKDGLVRTDLANMSEEQIMALTDDQVAGYLREASQYSGVRQRIEDFAAQAFAQYVIDNEMEVETPMTPEEGALATVKSAVSSALLALQADQLDLVMLDDAITTLQTERSALTSEDQRSVDEILAQLVQARAAYTVAQEAPENVQHGSTTVWGPSDYVVSPDLAPLEVPEEGGE